MNKKQLCDFGCKTIERESIIETGTGDGITGMGDG